MTRRTRRFAAIAVCAAAAAGTTTAATAQSDGAQAVTVDLTSGPIHMKFDAARAAGSKQTDIKGGSFSGELRTPAGNLVTVSGPITCLNVQGNRIGAFYPIDKITPGAAGMVMKGAYVAVQTDGKGHAKGMTFMMMATRKMGQCPAMGGMLPASGSAVTTGG